MIPYSVVKVILCCLSDVQNIVIFGDNKINARLVSNPITCAWHWTIAFIGPIPNNWSVTWGKTLCKLNFAYSLAQQTVQVV